MISIVIPYYYTPEDLLNRCLSSINKQCQIDPDLEVVLVNDGGPEYQTILSQSWNFKLRHIQNSCNMGPGVSRQIGVEEATQPYIIFCDSDDYFTDIAIQNYINNCKSLQYDIIYPARMQILNLQNPLNEIDNEFPDNLHGLCVKKSFMAEHNISIPAEYFHEDGLFTFNLNLHNPTVFALSDSCIIHSIRCGSLSYFKNLDLYQISMAGSIALFYSYFIPKDDWGLLPVTTNPLILEEIAKRIQYCLNEENINEITLKFLMCIWRTLPQSLRMNLKLPAGIMGYIVSNKDVDFIELKSAISELIQTESDHVIINYLRRCYDAYKVIYNSQQINADVSVVIPTYNNTQEQLMRCLYSIANQTISDNISLIIINDGSTNNMLTEEKLKKFNIPYRYKVLAHNCGVGAARQTGLAMVQTKYTMLMDMDDYLYDENVVYNFLYTLEHNPQYFGVRGNEYNVITGEVVNGDIKKCNTLHGLFFNTEVAKQNDIKFRPLQYVEDGLFLQECYLHQLQIITLPITFYARCPGYLTNNVMQPLCNLNTITDYICVVQRLIAMYTDPQHHAIQNDVYGTIVMYLHEMNEILLIEQPEAQADKIRTQLLRDHYFDLEEKRTIKTYSILMALQKAPEDLLIRLKYEYELSSYVDFILLIDDKLLKTSIIRIPYSAETISLAELERRTKNFVNLEIKKQIDLQNTIQADKDCTIPPQALKHLPWCYKLLFEN